MRAEPGVRSLASGRTFWWTGILFACLVAGCDALMSAEDRIERGQAELDAGDYAAAMADVRSALEAEPASTDGRILLARVMLKMGDPATARKELDRAIETGADPDAIRDLHYDILAGEGRHDDVIISAAVDEALEPRRRLRLIAAAQSAIGEHDKALVTIGEALAKDAGDPEAALIQAQALWGSGRQLEATKCLDEILAKHPQDARAALYRGRYALSLSDTGAAKKAFRQARSSASTQLDENEQLAIGAGLVEAHIGSGEMPEAATELADLEAHAPQSFLTRYLKGRLAYARGDYEAATAELQRALAARPDMPFAQLLLGASLLQKGALEQADAELSRLLARDPAQGEARALLARVYLARSDEPGARRILSEAPPGTANGDINLLTSGVLLRSGQTVEAIALLEEAAAAEPDNSALQLDLTRAYLSSGQAQEAIDTLTSMPADAGGGRRAQLMVLAAVAGRTPAEGTKLVERLIADRPRDTDTLVTAGAYFLSIGDNARATDAYRKALETAPTNPEALIGMAALHMRSGKLAEAEKSLRMVIDEHPLREQAYLALSDVAISRRDFKSARLWLERAVSANPSLIESRLRLAELSLEQGEIARAGSLVEQALGVTSRKAAVLQRAGKMYLRAGQFDKSLKHFQDAAALGATSAAIGAAQALLALGRPDEASSRLEAASRDHPSAAEPVAMLVSFEIRAKRFDKALGRVAVLEKAGGPAGEIAELRGDIQMASGKYENAVASYVAAAGVRPTANLATREFQARLAARMKSPETPLVQWLEAHPNAAAARMTLAAHYRHVGRNADAIAQYERVNQFGPSADALNNLAWIYHQTGDTRDLETARRAYELAPMNAAVADTYGWVLVERGAVGDGLRILTEAAKAAPGHPDIQFHHAVALARSGKPGDAAAILRRLLTPGTKFPSRAEAEALMARLVRE